jgi:hypothetical protein
MSAAEEAAIDAEFEECLAGSTLNSPAARYIRSLARDRATACVCGIAPLCPRHGHPGCLVREVGG